MRRHKRQVGKARLFLPILFLVACQAHPVPPFSTLVPPLITFTTNEIEVDGWVIPRFGDWRVVTSESGQPFVMIQVSPDEQQIITFAAQPQPNPPQPTTTEPIITVEQVIDRAERRLYVYGAASHSQGDALQTRLNALRVSVSPHD